MLNALTIDVEDYYQVSAFESVVRFEDWDQYESRVERNTYRILDILDEHKTKATFFVLGWVAERQPKLVKAIHERGHEVASHGYAHQRVYHQTPDQFRQETRRSKQILEDAICQPIIGYRAASYSITEKSLWALDILLEEGFLYDSSIFPVRHDLYGIPHHHRFFHLIKRDGRGILGEFPLSTFRMFGLNVPVAGGGYLRLFPYVVTRLAIKSLNVRKKQLAVVYLHPWEIDPGQPRLPGGIRSRFRHYVNLKETERTFQKLLHDFRFDTLKSIYNRLIDAQR